MFSFINTKFFLVFSLKILGFKKISKKTHSALNNYYSRRVITERRMKDLLTHLTPEKKNFRKNLRLIVQLISLKKKNPHIKSLYCQNLFKIMR